MTWRTTILRWVQGYTPEFQKRWNQFARPVGGSWRMDETYVRIKGEWQYLDRAVDEDGETVDFYLSRKRDTNAAKAFLRKGIKTQGVPKKSTWILMPPGIGRWPNLKEHGKLPQQVIVRSSKYLNNLIEQDHRRIKQRLRPMLGLESFSTAAVVISGIALAEKIRKGQFQIRKLGGATARMPKIWQAAIAA